MSASVMPPYTPPPAGQSDNYTYYQTYMNQLNTEFQKIMSLLGTVPAEEGVMIIMLVLMPFLSDYSQAQMYEEGDVMNQAASALDDISEIQSDFNAVGSYLQQYASENNGNIPSWGALPTSIQNDVIDAVNNIQALYKTIIIPAFEDAGNSVNGGKYTPPAPGSTTFEGPFASIAQNMISSITQATGLTPQELEGTATTTLAIDVYAMWAEAWGNSFSSVNQTGNPAQLNAIQTSFSEMENSTSGVSSEMQSQYKMSSTNDQQYLALEKKLQSMFLQMEQNENTNIQNNIGG